MGVGGWVGPKLLTNKTKQNTKQKLTTSADSVANTKLILEGFVCF